MIPIDIQKLDALSGEAKVSLRKRKNFNYHQVASDTLQRMLNAIEPGSYIQPHKHENPDKREVFIILRGSAVVFEFNDAGNVLQYHMLRASEGNFGVEIEPRVWHSIVALETGTVVYEVKDGPYNPGDDKYFAPWAPAENDTDAKNYLQKLLQLLETG